MIKDIDAVSRCIDPLINKYLVVAFILRDNDVSQRPFAYNVYVFFNCSNPSNIIYVDNTPLYPLSRLL